LKLIEKKSYSVFEVLEMTNSVKLFFKKRKEAHLIPFVLREQYNLLTDSGKRVL
jgi:hypothetical protein